MSAPPFLTLPPGAAAVSIPTRRGVFAAHQIHPRVDVDVAGAAALLVPGLTGSKEDFIAILGPLAAAGFAVTAFDQRGQYETPGPMTRPDEPLTDGAGGTAGSGLAGPARTTGTWTLQDFADDLVGIAAAVGGEPVHLVGHSFGGLVARAAILTEPSRFRSLVLLDSGPAAVGPAQRSTLLQLADLLEMAGTGPVWDLRQAADLEAGVVPSDDPEVRAFMRARFFENDPAGLAAIARILAAEPDRTDELAATGIPIMVAFGVNDLDSWPPEIQREMASRLGARCVSFPEAAHSPAAESPKETAEALASFWSETESTGRPPRVEEGL
jgi:pimeloyl-ACP methyl ester carboxylesterase